MMREKHENALFFRVKIIRLERRHRETKPIYFDLVYLGSRPITSDYEGDEKCISLKCTAVMKSTKLYCRY